MSDVQVARHILKLRDLFECVLNTLFIGILGLAALRIAHVGCKVRQGVWLDNSNNWYIWILLQDLNNLVDILGLISL